jgi:hypothetical protein
VLTSWERRLAAAGLAAAAAAPALLAAVDQHAAEIRDTLLADSLLAVEPAELVAAAPVIVLGVLVTPTLGQLASYLCGLVDQAADQGWRPPDFADDSAHAGWAEADWVTARVLAVCALARIHGDR